MLYNIQILVHPTKKATIFAAVILKTIFLP